MMTSASEVLKSKNSIRAQLRHTGEKGGKASLIYRGAVKHDAYFLPDTEV